MTLIFIVFKLYGAGNIHTSTRSSMIKRIQVTTCSTWPDTWITLSDERGQQWTYTLICAPVS